MSAFYNELDPYAAQWLRNLEHGGHIAKGVVSESDIKEIRPSSVEKFTQCHFFAGIGGWSYALRLAGWPDEQPVWTGSCPCQPFSITGEHRGFGDERHVWPAWFSLIQERRPPAIFGEQVASPDAVAWLDVVLADLEGIGYAVGAADLCAASVGAFHVRQRIFFVAYSDGGRLEGAEEKAQWGTKYRRTRQNGFWSNAEWRDSSDGNKRPLEPGTFPVAHGVSARMGRLRAYGNAIVPQVAAEFIKAAMP